MFVGYNEGADLRVEYNEGFEFAYRCRALSSPNRLAAVATGGQPIIGPELLFIHNSSMNSSARGQ